MLLFFGGIDMAYKKQKNVNIDALIAREDFEAADETTNTASKISTLSVNDLKEGSGLFLASVRKPEIWRHEHYKSSG